MVMLPPEVFPIKVSGTCHELAPGWRKGISSAGYPTRQGWLWRALTDITHLLEILNRLVEGGNTVIVIEHNLDVISSADWIIDMGPEGGNKGGRVIFEGTPRALLSAKGSLTSEYLVNAM
jgi:hypothetical protein